MKNRWILLLVPLLTLTTSCAQKPEADVSPSRLESLINQYVETQRGQRGSGDAADLSAERFLREIDEEKAMLEALRSVDPQGLSLPERNDLRLLIGRLESSIYSAERRRSWENDPTMYLPTYRIARTLQESELTEGGAQKVAAMLEAVPAALAHGKTNLKNPPPRRFTEAAIFQVGKTIETLETEVPGFADQAKDAKEALLKANDAAISACRDFEGFLQDDLLERSTGSWAIGAEEYNYILKHRWFLEEDAGSILEKGRKAFEETEALAQEVAERIEPGKHWVEVYERLKEVHPPADRLKEAYQAQIDRAKAYLIEHEIVTLPEGESVITLDTPPALRRSSPFGVFNTVGPFEDHKQGRLFLTPVEDWMTPEQKEERLRAHHNAWIPIIAVHEAYPGHHVQALKAKENPRILRRVIHESIFGEGWGLFTEQMMYEEGFLKGDDVRLTQLRNRLWRAARVILDVSLHTGDMTIDEAVDFLVDKVRFDRYAAELEVGMYPRTPTYVLGYLIGLMEIQDIRAEYYEKYGKPDKPKEFYDKLLSIGAIPPALVRLELFGPTDEETTM